MRLSTIIGDSGYIGSARCGVRVELNGQEVKRCFTADEEEGIVVVACLDERGTMQLDDSRRDVRRETLHGSVRIVLPPGHVLLTHPELVPSASRVLPAGSKYGCETSAKSR